MNDLRAEAPIGRRALLRAALAAVLAILAPRPGPAARASAPDPRCESARAVGRAYLRLHPEEADVGRLRRAVSGVHGPGLAERVRCDFERGEVVRVDGWVLSRSEARRCALAALSS